MRPVWLIAWSVLIEALRRKEIYAIVLVSTLLIGAVMTVDFFKIEQLTKFYREVALQVMGIATGLTVIVLAARQLPREFENRTIYPLLAKPISRMSFLLGKLLGVMLAAIFCYALFMVVYVLGTLYLGGNIPLGLFLQFLYLQLLKMLILATLAFWLSMLVNLDAAIALGVLFFAASSIMTNAFSILYPFADPFGQNAIVVLNYVIPQLTLFDLTEKAVHSEFWGPLDSWTMLGLTAYGSCFILLYYGFAYYCFRRRPL